MSDFPKPYVEINSNFNNEWVDNSMKEGGEVFYVPPDRGAWLPESDGRKLFGNHELRVMGRPGRALKVQRWALRERRATPERKVRCVPLEELSTAANTPEKRECGGEESSGDISSPPLWDRSLLIKEVLERFQPAAFDPPRKTRSEIGGARDARDFWMAESARINTVRPHGELLDARRVAKGEAGFYKVAKMLGEGKLSQYEQDKYWDVIASGSKHQVLVYLAKAEQTSLHNLTEHMRRVVAISLEKRKNYFDKSVRPELEGFVKFLRGHHEFRVGTKNMVAQFDPRQFFFTCPARVRHEVVIGPSPELLELAKNTNFPGLGRFMACTTIFMGSVASAQNWETRIWAFAQYVASFPETASILATCVIWTTKYVQEATNSWEAQAKGNDMNRLLNELEPKGEAIWVAFAKVIAGAFKFEAPEDTWKNAVRAKRFANISTLLKSGEAIITCLRSLFELVKEVVQAWSHGMSLMAWRLSSISAHLPRYAMRVSDLYLNNGVEQARINGEVAKEVLELFREGSRYMSYVAGGGARGGQYAAFQSVWRMVWELHESAKEYFLTHTQREEPFTIHLIGSSSIGKSVMSQRIIRDLVTKLPVDYNPASDHYFRNAEEEYWDGYRHQLVVFYDDFLQNPKFRNKECNELIKAVNPAAFPLNMARMELKGTTLFTSSFIMLTSNIDIPNDIAVADIMAVRRRRNVVIKMAVKNEYATKHGAVDVGKIQKGGCDPNIYQFRFLDPWDGTVLHETTQYSEVMEWLERKMHDSGRIPKSYKQQLKEIALEQHTGEFELPNEVQLLTEKMFQMDTMCSAVPLTPPSGGSSVSEDDERTIEEWLDQAQQNLNGVETNLKENMFQRWYYSFSGVMLTLHECSEYVRHKTEVGFNNAIGFGKNAYKSWLEYVSRNAKLVRDITTYSSTPLSKIDSAKLEMISNTIGVVLCCITTFAAGYGIYKMCTRSRTDGHPPLEAEQFASGDEKTRLVKKGFKVRLFEAKKMAQATSDPRALSLVRERFSNAVCLVRLRKVDGTEVGVHGLLIGGKLIAVPYHFFASTPYASDIVVITNTTMFEYPVNTIDVCVEWRNNDLAIIVMPNHFPSYSKLVQHFVNERDLQSLSLGHAGLLTMSEYDGYALPFFQMVQHPRRHGEHTYMSKGDEDEEITIIDSIHYIAQTQAGDCGAPVIWFHPSASRKILGFHVAGGYNVCASNILTHELMSQVFATLETTQLEAPTVEDGIPTLADGVANISQMGYFGLMNRSKQFRQPSRSEIIPSKIHGEFPIITLPAALLVKDGKSPLEMGVRKGCTTNCILPVDDLALVESQILQHYMDVVPKEGLRVLTMEEGINGVAGNPWIKAMKMKTSPGFPFITEKRQKEGKKDFFDWDGCRWNPSQRVVEMVERRIALARERKIPETVFVDVLKDERREIEKVEALKTRIFNTCPMDLNIAVRMYFGYLSDIIMENHVTHEIAVGINYHSTSWEMLYRRLKSAGSYWIAGDYSNYDKTFPRQLMMMVAKIANELYNDGNDTIRETLMETMCNRFHLANRVVYFQTHGNPSGNVLTTIVNSLGNMALMRLAWLVLARQHNPRLELDFENCVSLSVYGDDNVATVSNSCPWFNMNNIAKALAPYGVIYTPPKIGKFDSPDFLPVEEVTYLKRYFHQYRGMTLAPLPYERILETCNWIRRCNDEEEATRVNASMAQLEMFHWGHEKFDAFTREIAAILGRHGIKPKLTTWNYFYTKYLGGTLNDESFYGAYQDPITSSPLESEASTCPEASSQTRPGSVDYDKLVAQQQENKAIPTIHIEVGRNKTMGVVDSTGQNVNIHVHSPNMKAEASTGKSQPTKATMPKQGAAKSTPKKATNAKAKTTKGTASKATTNSSNTPQVLVVPTSTNKQLAAPSQGERLVFSGKEMIARIDEPKTVLAIPLIPGNTTASRLDGVTKHYSWAEWRQNPIINYRSLTSLANDGIWYYRVVHDVSLHDLLDVALWNISSKAFVAQKSHADFAINIPLRAMLNRRVSPQNSLRGSYVLLVYRGSEIPNGEFWLKYSVALGGVAAPYVPSTTYKVDNGIFYEPLNGKPIHGIPLCPEGHSSHYVFAPALSSRDLAQDFVRLHGGVPTAIVRDDSKTIIDKTAQAAELTLTNPPTHVTHHGQSVWDTLENVGDAVENAMPVIKTVVRRVAQSAKWLARVTGLAARSIKDDKLTMTGAFGTYKGLITVRHGSLAQEELATIQSMLPIYVNHNSQSEEQSLRMPLLPFIVGPLLGLSIATLAKAVRKVAQQPKLVHKGTDALGFVYDGMQLNSNDDSSDGNSGDTDSGVIDPDFPGNPLPDVPDFGDDETAPGEIIKWETTNRHVGGFVVDDNGTPIVKWVGATYAKMPLHISAPGPKYYYMERMPWDNESKRMLACYVEVDREMTGHYLLLQCVNWGDDGAGHWIRNIKGGTYFGTVARFGGLAESRSVVRVDDAGEWNSQPVHLLVGQSKLKYFSKDEGRGCVFYCSVGAVKSSRIAEKFLSAYDTSGVNALVNTYVDNKGDTYKTNGFASVSDVSLKTKSSPLPAELEPLAPGFSKNMLAWFESGGGAQARALPIAIEAGPIRGLILARYDEANGWWQHVPYCAISYTSLSARWRAIWLMGDGSTEDRYVKATADKGAKVPVLRITPPSILCSGAYCCVEIFTLSGNNNMAAFPTTPDGNQTIGNWATTQENVIVPTPISCTRSFFPAGQFDIEATGDTSRPTTAVAGYGGDEYVTVMYTVYLVKDVSAAKQWVRHELDNATFIKDDTSSGATGDNISIATVKAYKCDKDQTGSYLPLASPTWSPVGNTREYVKYAPLTTNCPLFSANGRNRETLEFCPKPWLINDEPSPGVAEPPPTSGVDVGDVRADGEPLPEEEEGVDVNVGAPGCCARCQALC